MNISSDKKLLVREEKQLNDWLCSSAQAEGTLNLMELKGFLFGICTTPHMLPPQVWLATIFGDELVEFEDDQLSNNLPLIFQLYNYTQRQVGNDKFKIPFRPVLNADNLSDNFKRGNSLRDWSYGFDVALQLTMGFWDLIPLDKDDDKFIDNCWLSLTFFADEEHTRNQYKRGAKSNKKFAEMAASFCVNLPDIAKAYAELCSDLYTESLDDEGFELEPNDEQLNLFGGDEPSPSDELFRQALFAPNRSESTRLAKQALKLDPNNIEIYLFLGHGCATNLKESIAWLEKAVQVGEQVLGDAFFRENTGHFWLIHATRPYMQALYDLACVCSEAGQSAQAIQYYEKCLLLNPNDNQGVRDILVGAYIAQHQIEKAEALMKIYEDDHSAFMRYSKVLIAYITDGDSPASRALKMDAKNYNKHVVGYLSGKHKMPKELPEVYGIGDKNEAVIYADGHRDVWRKTMGAIGWLSQ